VIPASIGRRYSSTPAAIRYGTRVAGCARTWSSSGVERQCAGQPCPASAPPQPAQRKRGSRSVT
jgi:hypothetical protein